MEKSHIRQIGCILLYCTHKSLYISSHLTFLRYFENEKHVRSSYRLFDDQLLLDEEVGIASVESHMFGNLYGISWTAIIDVFPKINNIFILVFYYNTGLKS